VPVALTRAIRFTPGAVLQFTPALAESLLGALRSARPNAAEALAAAQAARLTVDHLDDDACRICAIVDADAPPRWCGARIDLQLRRDGDQTYALQLAWIAPEGGERRIECAGVAPMLGGGGEVFFAQRSGSESRVWLKLSYSTTGAAEVRVLTAPFVERAPATMRVLLPGLMPVGALRIVS